MLFILLQRLTNDNTFDGYKTRKTGHKPQRLNSNNTLPGNPF